MEEINDVLEKITMAWDSFFLKYKFCQKEINFTEEVKTNYCSEILNFLNDTLNTFSNVEFENDFQKSLFQAVGLLQIMYAQQDIIDELLYIFKLQRSSQHDKSPTREIRNELIGHPIRKRNGELISSVFFGKHFKNGTLHYILYSKENDYSGKSVFHQLDTLILNHKQFLKKYLTIIWEKIKKILRRLQKRLQNVKSLVIKGIEFTCLLNLVVHYYDNIIDHHHLFKPEILKSCFEKQNEHPRYKNTIELFRSTIQDYLPGTINYIDEMFLEKKKIELNELPRIQIKFVTMDISRSSENSERQYLHYEFSKLNGKHPIFSFQYFKEKFPTELDILEELQHMEKQHDDLEFYSAYEYLRILLVDKGFMKS